MDISMTSSVDYNLRHNRTYSSTQYPPTPSYVPAPPPSYPTTYIPAPPPSKHSVPILSPSYTLAASANANPAALHPLGSLWNASWEAQIVTYTQVRGYVSAQPSPSFPRHSPSPSKRARIESVESRNSSDASVEKAEAMWTTATKPVPFSSVPTVNPKPFVPDVSFLRERRSSSAQSSATSDAGSSDSTLNDLQYVALSRPVTPSEKPTSERSSSRSSFNLNKKLPPAPAPPSTPINAPAPPPTLPAPITERTLIDLPASGELSANFVFAAPKSRNHSRKLESTKSQPPLIIRTHSQSLTVFGGLKAIWKKATAHVRLVKNNGLAAVVSAATQRESTLWSGFAPVVAAADSPTQGRQAKRSSIWWMPSNCDDDAGPTQPPEQMQSRPSAVRTRTGSSGSTAATFVTALSSR